MTDDAQTEAKASARILLLEDDETLASLLARVLRNEGYSVDLLDRADALPPPAKLTHYDVVLSDIHLAEGTSGHDVLREVRAATDQIPVILMTAYADIEGAMSAVSQGAYDYLAKPVEPNELKRMVGEAVARRRLAGTEVKALDPREVLAGTAAIVGSAPAMLGVYKTVAHVAPTTATVLIVGESGTGKELVARTLHTLSPRKAHPFVAVNCAAIPETLIESEIFGHEKGAFTGAIERRAGCFELANGGTLLLDELAEMPSPHNASSDLQTRPRQRPQEGVLSARELAAAFSLQYDPTMDAPRTRRRNVGLIKRLVAAAAMFLIFGGTAATFYYNPSLRQRIVDWVQDASPPATASTDTHATDSPSQKAVIAQTPNWMMPPPIDSPPITTPISTPVATPPKPQPGDVPPLSYTLPPVSKPTVVQQAASVVQPTNDTPPVSPSPAPSSSVASNIVIPGPNDASTAAAAAATQKLRQSAGGDLDTLAMELRGNGMDAEHRSDFAAAEYYYQQVEQLPHDHWPGDIEQLLKDAHQKVLDGANH